MSRSIGLLPSWWVSTGVGSTFVLLTLLAWLNSLSSWSTSLLRGTPLMLSGFGVMRVATPPFSRAVFSRLMPLSITER